MSYTTFVSSLTMTEDFIEVNDEQEVNNYDNFETPHEQAIDKRNRIRQHSSTVYYW